MPSTPTTPVASARPRARARVARLASLMVCLLLATSLSGCIVVDFFTPNKDDGPSAPNVGMVRIWAAAKPGALGPEYMHYNVSFGWTGMGQDSFLQNFITMRAKNPTVDLVRLERDQKAVMIADLVAPVGGYHGFAVTTTGAILGIDRIVGNVDGKPVTRVEETKIPHSPTGEGVPMPLRAAYSVMPGKITDLYLEIDVQESLYFQNNALQHVTLPHAVSIYIDNIKLERILLDGGKEAAEQAGRVPSSSGREAKALRPPWAEIDIRDAATDRIKYNGARYPLKRVNEAIGLGEELIFDASDSISYVMISSEGRAKIEEYLWDFGDGTTGKGPRVAKNYTEGGIFDVVLTVRDELNLVKQNYATLFVPYTADQAKVVRTDDRAGTLYVPSGALTNIFGDGMPSTDLGLSTDQHTFQFPRDLDNGALYLGGYRVSLAFASAGGGAVAPFTAMKLSTDSGEFQASTAGLNPLGLESAGVPVWRGRLPAWVDPELSVSAELQSGAAVDYTLHVEALYYDNLSRGDDQHALHRHGSWPYGPIWNHLDWDGRVKAEDETA